MPNPKVLIIDDEPSVCYSFRRVTSKMPVEVLTAATVSEGLASFAAQRPEVVILDLNLPDGNGLDAFRKLRAIDASCPVLFITAHGTSETALQAMKDGAFDYLVKPVDLDRLAHLLERALETARAQRTPALAPSTEGNEGIIGHSSLMQEMCKDIGLLAPQEVNVLILGESGVGKELVARALFQHSRRHDRPFLAINCAALPEQLLESELFGHEQGAFTGAHRQRVGKFEQCRDGTLFLDEIGDMSLAVQAKMLRVLQDQRFERIGGNQTVQTSVRLLAATNQDLEKAVAEGRFRADLYYRLKVATIHVPSLRERPEDILELAQHFLVSTNRKLGLQVRGFDPETVSCLQAYPWPGNVRELQSVIKDAMVRTRGPLVLPEFLPPQVLEGARPFVAQDGVLDLHRLLAALQGEKHLYSRVVQELDRILLTEIMKQTGGNQAKASEILGIDRKTLRLKLRNLGLSTSGLVLDRNLEAGTATPLAPRNGHLASRLE